MEFGLQRDYLLGQHRGRVDDRKARKDITAGAPAVREAGRGFPLIEPLVQSRF